MADNGFGGILADDMGYGDVGCYNPLSKIPTPNMDLLANQGMCFTNAHSPSAVCTPTRYGLMTGRYCWRSNLKEGVLYNYELPLIEPDRATLPSMLREKGYHTGCIGKWHLGTTEGPVPKQERGGYDYWLAANLLEFVSDAYDCVLYNEDNQKVKLPGYRVDGQTDAAIRYIDNNKDNEKPFFLFISYLEPVSYTHLTLPTKA
mgnify:CR=1 FL=1